MICFHKWGKYGEPFDTATDDMKLQARRCEKCGKVEASKVKKPWNQWFQAAVMNKTLEAK